MIKVFSIRWLGSWVCCCVARNGYRLNPLLFENNSITTKPMQSDEEILYPILTTLPSTSDVSVNQIRVIFVCVHSIVGLNLFANGCLITFQSAVMQLNKILFPNENDAIGAKRIELYNQASKIFANRNFEPTIINCLLTNYLGLSGSLLIDEKRFLRRCTEITHEEIENFVARQSIHNGQPPSIVLNRYFERVCQNGLNVKHKRTGFTSDLNNNSDNNCYAPKIYNYNEDETLTAGYCDKIVDANKFSQCDNWSLLKNLTSKCYYFTVERPYSLFCIDGAQLNFFLSKQLFRRFFFLSDSEVLTFSLQIYPTDAATKKKDNVDNIYVKSRLGKRKDSTSETGVESTCNNSDTANLNARNNACCCLSKNGDTNITLTKNPLSGWPWCIVMIETENAERKFVSFATKLYRNATVQRQVLSAPFGKLSAKDVLNCIGNDCLRRTTSNDGGGTVTWKIPLFCKDLSGTANLQSMHNKCFIYFSLQMLEQVNIDIFRNFKNNRHFKFVEFRLHIPHKQFNILLQNCSATIEYFYIHAVIDATLNVSIYMLYDVTNILEMLSCMCDDELMEFDHSGNTSGEKQSCVLRPFIIYTSINKILLGDAALIEQFDVRTIFMKETDKIHPYPENIEEALRECIIKITYSMARATHSCYAGSKHKFEGPMTSMLSERGLVAASDPDVHGKKFQSNSLNEAIFINSSPRINSNNSNLPVYLE